MQNTTLVLLALAATLFSPAVSRAQGEAAVPFLQITPSPEGNGMGGISASQRTDDAFATIANPGQLGLFGLTNLFNASTYTPRTNWMPQFHISGLTYGVTALNAGYNFRDILSLPFDLSAGIGYSRVSLDLGTFVVTSPSGPAGIGSFEAKEHCDSYSFGIGFDYCVRLGIGFNFKNIESHLSPVGTEQEEGAGSGSASARDFGLLLEVPIVELFTDLSGTSLEIAPRVFPFLDLSLGYVRANVGDEISYPAAEQADPLPRTAVTGVGLEVGLIGKSGESDWKIASFGLLRQGDDLLVTRNPDGTFEYQSGLGDMRFWNDVVLGNQNSKITMRRGWQLQVAEILYLRGGSVESPGLSYTTSGYSACLGGLLKLVGLLTPGTESEESWVAFVAHHFDLQFHASTYSETTSPISGTTSQSLNLVVKGFSF
jgi:hypothetical protein